MAAKYCTINIWHCWLKDASTCECSVLTSMRDEQWCHELCNSSMQQPKLICSSQQITSAFQIDDTVCSEASHASTFVIYRGVDEFGDAAGRRSHSQMCLPDSGAAFGQLDYLHADNNLNIYWGPMNGALQNDCLCRWTALMAPVATITKILHTAIGISVSNILHSFQNTMHCIPRIGIFTVTGPTRPHWERAGMLILLSIILHKVDPRLGIKGVWGITAEKHEQLPILDS